MNTTQSFDVRLFHILLGKVGSLSISKDNIFLSVCHYDITPVGFQLAYGTNGDNFNFQYRVRYIVSKIRKGNGKLNIVSRKCKIKRILVNQRESKTETKKKQRKLSNFHVFSIRS